jgi:hypothetical protein
MRATMNRLTRIAARLGVAILCAIAGLYLADFGYFRYRLSKNAPGNPLKSEQIQSIYAIPHKDGRAEFVFGPKQTVTCVRSIFPHMGSTPCWYLERNAQRPIQM